MESVTLRNDFHHTFAVVYPRENKLTKYQLQRARKKLCGIHRCICGMGPAGERGQQHSNGQNFHLETIGVHEVLIRYE